MAAPPQQQFPLFDADSPEAVAAGGAVPPAGKFSNFIVYVDESGDHGMATLDPNYPVFVLAFCMFYKGHYSDKVVQALHKLKFNHFGHDLVVLHEHEIRKEKGAFKFQSRAHREHFQDELGGLIEASNFILISCVIDKVKLRARSEVPPNPYHVALGFCLETLYELLQEKRQDDALTHVVVECRGKKEDDELELEFRRICDGANRLSRRLPFNVVFADKKVDSPSLQLADLVARPIGLHVLRPAQPNRAFDVLTRKFYCSGGRSQVGSGFDGWGLKVFPQSPESEKPR